MAKQQGQGEDVLLRIGVDGADQIKSATADSEKLKNSLKEGGKVDAGAGTKSLKQQLRDAIIEAQKLAAQGKENTKEFTAAAKNVANIKDRIQELNRTFDSFDPDNKFKVFSQFASSGAKIVQGYAGAMTLLGVNEKDAAKTMAELQGLMAFTDAIDSLHDIKDSFKDLGRLLGLTKSSVIAVTEAQTEQTAAVVDSVAVQAAAEAELEAARASVSETSIAADEALLAVRATVLTETEGLTAAETAYLTAANARAEAVTRLTAAQEALTAATAEAAAGAATEAVAMEGVTVAEAGAEAGAIGLGTALKAIGIGLLISAIAYLISNFDKVKKAVTDLFPALGKAGTLMNTLKEVAFGVGNVILQFVIAPIKILIDLLKGDLQGAIDDAKKAANVVSNYQEGAAKEAADIAEEARKVRVQKEIEANERIIKERGALGKSVTALEVANNKLKISILDADDKDYAKKKLDLESENTVALNAEWKKQNDKYKEKLKTDLEAIKASNIENLKTVKEGVNNQRSVELTDLDVKYNKELALLNKRKANVKDYNKEYNTLIAARKIEEQRVNKKYDDAIKDYSDEVNQTYFDAFEKKEAEIKKKAEELLKNANPQEKAQITQNETFLLNKNTAESVASSASNKANTDLTNVENSNRPNDKDTPDEARVKVDAVEAARLDAEQKAYELKKAQAMGQNEELAQLAADHDKTLSDIALQGSDARKAIDDAEKEAKLNNIQAVGDAANAFAQLAGQNTIAGKALGIASATIDTYVGASKALAQGGFLGIAGAAAVIATGIANVKKIISTKVPGASGGATGSAPSITAPVINTTVLNQDKSGSANVVSAVSQQQANQQPLKAYITNKDLNQQKANTDFFNQQSTY